MLPKKYVTSGIFSGAPRGGSGGGVETWLGPTIYISFFMLTLSCRTKISLSSLKSKVTSVLLSIPGGRIHLMKFRELYDKRYTLEKRLGWEVGVVLGF